MNAVRIAFVISFFAITASPALLMAFPAADFSALFRLDEKRNLAPPPDVIGKLLHEDGRLSADINRWFDDRIAFRPFLVRLQHQLDYWLFRHSDKIFIGRDGWLFQPTFLYVKIRDERGGEDLLAQIRERFFQLSDYLARRNIRLIVISTPDKQIIYPEYMPPWVPRLPANNMFQKIRAFLKGQTEWINIDGQDVLQQHCSGHRTFHLIDIHTTYRGGICFAQELVARVAAAEQWPASPWDHTFTFTAGIGTDGGQSDFLALLFPPVQRIEIPSPIYGLDNSSPEGTFTRDPERVFDYIYHAHPSNRAGKLPPIALFGDSFLDQYRTTGFFVYFSDVYRARDTGHNLSTVLRSLPSDTRYFVYQFIAPFETAIVWQDIPKE